MSFFTQWEVLHGHTQESILRHFKAHMLKGAPLVVVARKPTAKESWTDFLRIVPEAIVTGKYGGTIVRKPESALFQMYSVGMVIRHKSTGQKVVGYDTSWDLYAQADARGYHINIWAVHLVENHVAKTMVPRSLNIVTHAVDTQKFTFRNANNDTEIIPTIDNFDIDYELIFLDMDRDGKETKMKIEENSTMKMLCTQYAHELDKDLKSLRFSYAGKPLFMSAAGKKRPSQLGIVNMDVILVSSYLPSDEDDADTSSIKKATRNTGRKKGKGKGGKKKKPGPRPMIEVKKSDKEEHSKGMLG